MTIPPNYEEQYPYGPLPRRLIIAGKKDRGRLRGELVRLKRIADVKRQPFKSDVCGSPSDSLDESHLRRVLEARNMVDESGEVTTR